MDILCTMPDQSVNCCITSPPYWGLRDYGVDGQLGLEKTPEQYVARMVEVFREVRRVLRNDGTVFLNLGDSYFGSNQTGGKNSKEGSSKRAGRMFAKPLSVQHEDACGISDKEPEDCQERDCLCENLCGECRSVYLIGKSRSENPPDPRRAILSSAPIPEHMESAPDHSPTSDFSHPEVRNSISNQDSARSLAHEPEPLPSSLVSTQDDFCPQCQEDSRQSDTPLACPLCGWTSEPCARECGHKTACTFGTWKIDHPFDRGNPDIFSLNKAYPYYTTTFPNVKLKPKDLVGIPWRVAFALQADGWYLRQDIIWSKPNPMPESVNDRCTKSHEYIFMLSKSKKYYYDQKAIKEPGTYSNEERYARIKKEHKSIPDEKQNGLRKRKDKQRGHGRRHTGFNNRWDEMTKTEQCSAMRNKRDVWTVATQPFKEAYFATFPPKLIEPCVLAGCPEGGIILDPFGGSGTTGMVAKENYRNYILIDLKKEYTEMADNRIAATLVNKKLEFK